VARWQAQLEKNSGGDPEIKAALFGGLVLPARLARFGTMAPRRLALDEL